MTLPNAKNSLTILLGILVIASVGIVSSMTVSFALNQYAPNWSSSTQTYQCMVSLDTLGDSYVNECGDLATAANYWNNVANSNWSLTKSSSGTIKISGADLGSGSTDIAQATLTTEWDWMLTETIVGAKIEFNNQKSFTDVAQASSTTSFDWQSVAVHEMGHILKLHHELIDTDSPMYGSLNEGDQRRTLVTHDEDVIKEKY